MSVARVNGKLLASEKVRRVRAIHYGDKIWYTEEDSKNFNYTTVNNEIAITGYTSNDT